MLRVAALARAGLFRRDGGTRSATIDVPDPRDPAAAGGERVEVEPVGPGSARVAIGGQAVEAFGRPGINGGTWWEFRCPTCGRAVRMLYSPTGADAYRCSRCWNVAKAGREPRMGDVATDEVARRVARLIAEASCPT